MLSSGLAIPYPELTAFLEAKLRNVVSLSEIGLEENTTEENRSEGLEKISRDGEKDSTQVEETDGQTSHEKFLERRHAALLTHLILRDYLHEEDEEDISAAFGLKDLYECKHCFTHIAQIYAKGIMEAEGAFRLYDGLSCEEAETIVSRMTDKSLRVPPQTTEGAEVMDFSSDIKEYLLIDVRDSEEADADPLAEIESSNARRAAIIVNIPLRDIVRNPHVVRTVRGLVVTERTPIVLYCDEGTRSMAAATCLIKSGYKKVYVTRK